MDEVIIEQRLISHPTLSTVAVGGTAYIRVIVYKGIPAMAMTRLPTVESGGRANLHQGAVAAAVDLATGQTFGGVMHNRIISVHPDTNAPIAGIEIPNWKELLTAAMKLSDALEMGYVGVDFVVDAHVGPFVLEANARPGLAIQVAHRQGLRPRLDFIDEHASSKHSCDTRWEILKDLSVQFARLTSATGLGATIHEPRDKGDAATTPPGDEHASES
jgi:alpha-L-glutamate ligase-like protein